mmetsp:Transcript_12056/g.28592  ORF Transcript_12056/g.28592 Transcript_12056/m.28592 type:complete len:221 (-) Transcript_12056:109-771(-)
MRRAAPCRRLPRARPSCRTGLVPRHRSRGVPGSPTAPRGRSSSTCQASAPTSTCRTFSPRRCTPATPPTAAWRRLGRSSSARCRWCPAPLSGRRPRCGRSSSARSAWSLPSARGQRTLPPRPSHSRSVRQPSPSSGRSGRTATLKERFGTRAARGSRTGGPVCGGSLSSGARRPPRREPCAPGGPPSFDRLCRAAASYRSPFPSLEIFSDLEVYIVDSLA